MWNGKWQAFGLWVILNVLQGAVGTSRAERSPLNDDQAQDALDRPIVEETVTSYDMHPERQLSHCPPSILRQHFHSGSLCQSVPSQGT
ncbi:hypothetical protein TNCV_3393471 [Trichonephila clavipes]|nr:hypothetical protein TNCV_3393471 [Trichonephila clavipes]